MKLNKKLSIFLVFSLFMGLFASLSGVSAYSEETTNVGFEGLDNNQQTFVKVGTHNIYVFDNTLIDYNDDAELIATLTLPYPSNSSTTHTSKTVYNESYRTSVIYFNITHILVLRQVQICNKPSSTGYTYGVWETAFVNINTLGYTVITSHFKVLDSASYAYNYWQPEIGTQVIIKNINETGTFYYAWTSFKIRYSSSTYFYYSCINYIGKNLISGWTNGGTWLFQQSTESNYLKSNNLAIDSSGIVPSNYAFVLTSNSFVSGNRANIYMLQFSAPFTVSFIGVTSLDNTYTGNYDYHRPNIVQLIGVGAYNGLISVNIAYGLANPSSGLGFTTILFNSSYVTNSYLLIGGMSTGSDIIRPFTVAYNTGFGNSSARYTVAWFDDIFPTWALSGWSATLTGIENNAPVWETYEFGFLYTPQEPQSYPYYLTSTDWSGLLPIGSNVGVFIDDTNNLIKANYCFAVNAVLTFYGYLNGDIFINAGIAQAPIEITLKQGTTYTFTGKIFIDSIMSGNGTYSIMSTEFISNSAVFTSYDLVNKQDNAFTGGIFSFTIAPVTSTVTVYRVISVNFTLSDSTQSTNYIYNFGFYASGGSGNNNGGGGIPYPSITPLIGGGDLNGVSGIDISGGITIGDFSITYNFIVVLLIYGIICSLLTLKFAFTGLIAGFNISTIICLIIGILGYLTYPAIGLMALADIALILTGSGLLNKTKNTVE